MKKKHFRDIEKFIKFMRSQSDRVWINDDNPIKLLIGVVDEHLEFALSIKLADYKKTAHLIKSFERQALVKEKKPWLLIEGCSITDEQIKYLDSGHKDITQLAQDRLRSELCEGPLRTQGGIEFFPKGQIPLYVLENTRDVFYLGENGINLKVAKKEKLVLPFFEVHQNFKKICPNIWDIEIFPDTNGLLIQENVIYARFKEIMKKDSCLRLVERHPLTVLFYSDWSNKEIGLSIFEHIGVGLF